MDALKVLSRCQPKAGKVGSYVAITEFGSSHWNVFLRIGVPKKYAKPLKNTLEGVHSYSSKDFAKIIRFLYF